MPELARPRPRRLWRHHAYPMHDIASGLPVRCLRGRDADYTCKHNSFLVGLRRFAGEEDVVFRAEPLIDDGVQIGFEVQFFWDRLRSRGDAIPDDFVYPTASEPDLPQLSPYVREKYAHIAPEMRAPVAVR